MLEQSRTIRDLCNHPWKREVLFQDKIKWDKLWASLDAIDDTQLAIERYLRLDDFSAYDGGYLFVCGIMQALNIQQDAVNNLFSVLLEKEIDFKTEYPALYEIREHRNNSIGHPTKRGNNTSFHYTSRVSIKKDGFRLASSYPKTGKKSRHENIAIMKCINTQKDLIENILEKVIQKLKLDFEKHKSSFKGKKLVDLIHNDFHYEFSKLYENINRDYPLVSLNFNTIFEAYNKIKEGIKERYFSIEALPGVEDSIQILDYIFNRLKRDLIENKIDDEFELSIFIDALQSNFKVLQEMSNEIDKEFGH